MNYKDKITKLLEEFMTEKSFKLWVEIDKRLPQIWDRKTSSTGKHHKKLNGEVPSNAEHVYHMLYACSKVYRSFNYVKQTTDLDKLLLAIVLHDCLKYGETNGENRPHTDRKHDKLAADLIWSNKNTFMKIFTEQQFVELEEATRFHSGRWSTDVPKNEIFDFNNYDKHTFFVHILDMMSTADLIQTDVRE